jgi:dephospho-CoA kinase
MIIGVCGRIGAGKETLTKFLRDKGFVYLESRKGIKEELEREGKEVTRESLQDKGDELRKKYGVGAVMILLLDKTRKDEKKNYIFDSLRNAGEAEFLRKERKDFVLIGVDAPREIRFKRMLKRAKPSDPKTWEDFLKVDERDNFDVNDPLGQQTGKLLEIADFVIVNDGDLDRAMNEVCEIWEKIECRFEAKA